jgi:hypothetical protein
MKTYLFDSSAAVEIYTPRSSRINKIVNYVVEQKSLYRQASLYIPNFCIVEVFNTFAKKHFDEQTLTKEQYEDTLKRFRKDVHWAALLYPYDLNRYHILASDEIIPIEHHVARTKEWDHLSTFDILLIAMASELAFMGSPEDLVLLTCDKRIKRVCDEFRRITPNNREEWKVPREFGEPKRSRWIAPPAIYLPEMSAIELSPVHRQPHLQL